MSLVALLKSETEGFAFSDGAASSPQHGIVCCHVPKIVALRNDLVAAVGGDALDSEILKLKMRELPNNIPFSDALAFLRGEIAEHRRIFGKSPMGADSPHNLGVGLLGLDTAKQVRLIGWDVHTGEEKEQPESDGNWFMALNEEARCIAGALTVLAHRRYCESRDAVGFIKDVEGAFETVSRMHPRRIGGQFYWAHVGTGWRFTREAGQVKPHPFFNRAASAMDTYGNLKLKNIAGAAILAGTAVTEIGGISQIPGIVSPGSGYNLNDQITITPVSGEPAFFKAAAETGGGVTLLADDQLNRGNGFSNGTYSTTTSGSGLGLTVSVVATTGAVPLPNPVTVTTRGNNVLILADLRFTGYGGDLLPVNLYLFRDGSVIQTWPTLPPAGATSGCPYGPCTPFYVDPAPAAGTYTYQVYASLPAGLGDEAVTTAGLLQVIELG